jgi:hypothetical protein
MMNSISRSSIGIFFLIPILLISVSITQVSYANTHTAKTIVFNDVTELELLNQKINQKMYDIVPNYNAEKWGDVLEHPNVKGLFILVINEDVRNPVGALNSNEKLKIKQIDRREWKEPKTPEGVELLGVTP